MVGKRANILKKYDRLSEQAWYEMRAAMSMGNMEDSRKAILKYYAAIRAWDRIKRT